MIFLFPFWEPRSNVLILVSEMELTRISFPSSQVGLRDVTRDKKHSTLTCKFVQISFCRHWLRMLLTSISLNKLESTLNGSMDKNLRNYLKLSWPTICTPLFFRPKTKGTIFFIKTFKKNFFYVIFPTDIWFLKFRLWLNETIKIS